MNRTRTTDIHPYRTDTITVTTEQARNLAHNPNTRAIRHAERVGANQVRMTIERVDPTHRPPRRRLTDRIPYRLTLHPDSRRPLLIAAIIAATLAVLFAAGWLTWLIFAPQITAAFKVTLSFAALAATIGAIAWLTKIGTGCPGLHCGGCSRHH
jgi:hypothetical protein